MKVIKEKTVTAPKFMIFGGAGVGKTTIASKLNNSLVLDIEGGANFLDTPRTEQITKLDTFYEYLAELWKTPKREYDYLVIDTADWLVRLIIEQVAGIDKLHLEETLNRSNGGYGNGKQVLENHIRSKLLPMLVLLNKKGYGICLLAHSEKKILLDSDGTNVEQVAPKIEPNTMNIFVEWCDGVFYLKKGLNGERILQMEADDTALAKNRMGISGEYDLSDYNINNLVKGNIKKGEK